MGLSTNEARKEVSMAFGPLVQKAGIASYGIRALVGVIVNSGSCRLSILLM